MQTTTDLPTYSEIYKIDSIEYYKVIIKTTKRMKIQQCLFLGALPNFSTRKFSLTIFEYKRHSKVEYKYPRAEKINNALEMNIIIIIC